MSPRRSDAEVVVHCLRAMVLAGMLAVALVAGLLMIWGACRV